jgi:hypothetical protein
MNQKYKSELKYNLDFSTLDDFYNIDDFKNKFLNINFDDILIEQNSKFINSNIYLDSKIRYIEHTHDNIQKLNLLLVEYSILNNLYTKDSTLNKYTFHVVNNEKKEKLNTDIKNIINIQKKLYDNFIHYIQFLTN